jgi:hypothetical protein
MRGAIVQLRGAWLAGQVERHHSRSTASTGHAMGGIS